MAPIPAGTNQIRAEVLALLASLWLYTERSRSAVGWSVLLAGHCRDPGLKSE
jgi:hypothetical protein